jgi:hypothetical protein
MALLSNSKTSFDTAGKTTKENLGDVISNISPFETPFMSSVKKVSTSSTKVEWLKDGLATPVANNAQLEGEVYSATSQSDVTRLNNNTQISAKSFAVTGTQDAQDSSGLATMSAYLLAKNAKVLKNDIETSIFQNGAKNGGGASTARVSAGINTWLGTNTDAGTGGADPSALDGAQVRTDASTSNRRALSETLLKTVSKSVWDNGGSADTIYVGSANKQLISTSFTGGATKQVQSDTKAIVGAVDIYVGDFSTYSVIPARHMRARDALVIDHSLWEMAELRPYKVEELAKTGDNRQYLLTTEWSLCAKNEAGNGGIYDLT